MTQEQTPTDTDVALLRDAIRVSTSAVENGNHPFGAILVDPAGTVVLSAENSVTTGNDVTCHAETNLVRLAVQHYTTKELQGFSLYTSCEPCAMCSGAIYWAGIGRVVFALAESTLLELTGTHPENPTLAVPCRRVFDGGQRATTVVGPVIEDEAAKPHRTFWR